MSDLQPVDRLEVLVLIDNVTDSLSTNPSFVTAEWFGLLEAGRLPVLSGERTCHAHHGLSLLLIAQVGGRQRTLLFDTGPEGATLLRNARLLGVALSTVDAVVLSHGHWDHGGGLVAAIEAITTARGGVRCVVHPGMFVQRATRHPNGALIVHERLPVPERLAEAGAEVVSTDDEQLVCDGAFYVSGEVPRVTSYETGLPGHVRRSADDQPWEPDPLIMDERYIAVHVRNRGLIVLSACSHAGIINVLTHARAAHAALPLYGVVGGLHLSGATERVIPDTVRDLASFDLQFVAPAHCTGWKAVAAMRPVFGDRVVPSAVGKRYVIV